MQLLPNPTSAKSDLEAIRDRYLHELVEMARDRGRAEQKLADIRSLERAIAVVQPPGNPKKYGAFKRAIDAMLDYLDEVGAPVNEGELVDVVVARGFRGPMDAKDVRSAVLKSMGSYFAGEAGKKRRVIRKVGDMVGRGESRKP